MPTDPSLRRVRLKVKVMESKIKELQDNTKPKIDRPTIKLGNNTPVTMKKSLLEPNFKNKTVLTDSTWRYVEIFLKKINTKESEEALFYWEQAQNFYHATKHVDLISAPLPTYYCFLNATKALLTFKGVNFGKKHGVSGTTKDGHVVLQNEIITFKTQGILPSLCRYLGEPIEPPKITPAPTGTATAPVGTATAPTGTATAPAGTATAPTGTATAPAGTATAPVGTATAPAYTNFRYNLKDILYNLEYIHRAYTLTYPREAELFIPILEPRFVHDKTRKKGWFEARLEKEHSNKTTLTRLKGFSIDRKYENSSSYVIRLNKTFHWDAPRNSPTERSELLLNNYYKNIRSKLRYIYSPNNLWYIKRRDVMNKGIINRSSLTLTFAAMHRLSELSRYDPKRLSKHLDKDSNWLLSEFITKSMYQYIDQISSEITGDDFRVTGFRA